MNIYQEEGFFPPPTSKSLSSTLTRFQTLENGNDTWGNWKVLFYFVKYFNQFFMSSPDCASQRRNSLVKVNGLCDGIKTAFLRSFHVHVPLARDLSMRLEEGGLQVSAVTGGFSNLQFTSCPATDFPWDTGRASLHLSVAYFHACEMGLQDYLTETQKGWKPKRLGKLDL